VPDQTPVTVFLFTDIEGSTRLWEEVPEGMRDALIQHDAIAAQSVTSHRGRVVKTTGDGVHAVFHDPLDAVKGAVAMQLALGSADFPSGIACGFAPDCMSASRASERTISTARQ
jgi:class 3 adenylate cyclase